MKIVIIKWEYLKQITMSKLFTFKIVAWICNFLQRIIIIIIIIYSLEFFTSVLADGFSLESEWQQVSSSLQDSSQYSGRLQLFSSLDGLHSSANFQVFPFLLVIL